jgi:hypothetical protein
MKSLDKINKIADRFEHKIAQQAQTQQAGTTDLFFGSEANQVAFAAAIQNPKGAPFKVLNDCYTKTQAACSFDLKASAEPGVGAKWILTVNPTSIQGAVKAALDSEFQKIMKTSMDAKQQTANTASKQNNAGSGTNDIGALDLS